MKIANQQIELVPIDSIQPHPANPREGDVGAVADSLDEHGFYGVCVCQVSTRYILAGNHRWKAAKFKGATAIPVAWIDCDDDEALRILLVDNRTSDIASYDDDQLAALLRELAETERGLAGTGYDGDALDELLSDIEHQREREQAKDDPGARTDHAAELQKKWGTAEGDVWTVGPHRIVCGDSREHSTLYLATEGRTPDMLLTDPPYGIDALHADGRHTHDADSMVGTQSRSYTKIIGDDEPFDPTPIREFFAETREQFWFGADYYRRALSDNDHDGSWLVWDKRSETADAGFGSGFELVWSRQRHKRDLLRHYYFGAFGADAQNRQHPTQKPVPLMRDIIERWSQPGMLVADPFIGSGAVIVACVQADRVGCGIDRDPRYVAVTLERLAGMGLDPVRAT